MHICFHSPKFTRLRKQKAKERQAPVFHLHIESIVVGTSLIVHFSNTRIMLDVGTWILLSHTRQHKDVRKIQPVLWENPAGMSSILFTIGHLVT
ncbi:hypothetical protein M8J76_000579 [Diaphorina citri]|nr:hypothetical protein M8J75_006163 [Diaphorina citri]KAI5748611.1 hypothetical protein M8J76_000579 [Diaphorina citri]KAI5756473.1 hypothetical protein M8J77_025330 [Diaphorina citri]